ncbi:MAG: hypothetical protein DRI95_00065 [Bacteroidetes bacterium]|nr:MAG: hypothetical protein DRI95_00065 [Bacteroidota bacterium]RLD81967.1 MAG: hypothetical protein DRJ07_08695 [Bacteroidota bacterium]
MENSNIDKITKDILQNSALELKNPDFNSIIMNKIISENRKQRFFYNSLLYMLIFIIFDIFIILLLKFFNINIFQSYPENDSLAIKILKTLNSLGDIVFGNSIIQYSIISLFIVFIVNKLSSSVFKHS